MEQTRENPLGREKIGALLARFAVPSIIAMLVSALYNIVDQFFIGWSVGMLGNAATNVAFPLTITCTGLSLLCGIGGAANFNLCMGRKDAEKAERFAGAAIGMMLILGMALCIGTRLFLRPLMLAFGATADSLDYALAYTGITSFGFPFLILTTAGSNLIRADGSPRFSMLCTLSGAARGRFTGASLKFACVCIRKLLALAPPSTFSAESVIPESASIACRTSFT